MTRLTVCDAALLKLRIAPHALWEVVASSSVLASDQFQPQFSYRSWARSALATVAGGPGASMVRWAKSWPVGTLPRFLLIPPDPGGVDLADISEYARQLSPCKVRERLRAEYPTCVPAGYTQFDTDPSRAIAAFADMASEYAEAVIAPHWPSIQETVREEVLLRAHILALAGVDALLEALHRRITWSRPQLSVSTMDAMIDGAHPDQIMLVPLVFVQDRVVLSMNGDATLAIGYQSRSAGNLAIRLGGLPGCSVDRLGLLLGATRAAILRSLVSPSTTTSLAAGLHLAPSTVSEHLGLLVGTRIAVKRRSGNKVYYVLSEQGISLLRALSDRED